MATSTATNSASTSSVKILTVGSAVGSIRDLFAKIKGIDAKYGKFDFVLCTGDFFGPPKGGDEGDDESNQVSQLLSGELEAPLKCYIVQGEHPIPQAVIEKYAKTGGELCKDVLLLHKSGVLTTAHGLRIACLGGTYDTDIYNDVDVAPGFASPFFTSKTVELLLSNSLTKSSTHPSSYGSLAAIRDNASQSQLIDILVSNVWPSNITIFSSTPLPSSDLTSIGVPPLDTVVRKIKPRYMFAAAGGHPSNFWEREPFIWDDEGGRVTRFVSLGAFGGEATQGKKQRWFYAFSIEPGAPSAPPQRPANATKNPFTEAESRPPKRALEPSEGQNFIWGDVRQSGKRSRTDGARAQDGKPPPGYQCRRCQSTEHFINDCPERAKPPEGYICKICNTPGHLVRDCPTRNAVGDTGGAKPREGYVCRACGSDLHYLKDCPVANQEPQTNDRHSHRKPGPPREIAPDECWFCLSNPNLAKHLIVSIGTECYLTLPKGQIIPTQTASEYENLPNVPGGGHVLIVPIAHHPTFNTIPPDLAAPIINETEKYKNALRAFYAKHGAAGVFFEVGRLMSKGGHAHVQAVPVPIKLKDKVEGTFVAQGRSQGIEFLADADADAALNGGGTPEYLRVDLPDGRKIVHIVKPNTPFNLQFGRKVLATLLEMANRADWKSCMLSEEEDKADAQAFKTAFKPFEPV